MTGREQDGLAAMFGLGQCVKVYDIRDSLCAKTSGGSLIGSEEPRLSFHFKL